MTTLSLIVIYCEDIHLCKQFYEMFGLSFTEEKHGVGPIHFSSKLNGVLLELYPAGNKEKSKVRLGFKVKSLNELKTNLLQKFPKTKIKSIGINNIKKLIITDLDGRKIEAVE